jgi:hypothetical protein
LTRKHRAFLLVTPGLNQCNQIAVLTRPVQIRCWILSNYLIELEMSDVR